MPRQILHRILRTSVFCTLTFAFIIPNVQADVTGRADVRAFIAGWGADNGFSEKELNKVFSDAVIQNGIIDAISRPAERTIDWKAYRKIFIQESRIEAGAQFMLDNRRALQGAEKKYGVPAELITAIIGVETKYGAIMGRHQVLDALVTLAFQYPKRALFFRKELQQYLLLCREQGFDPREPKGSYAGAMGFGQFMPSSYRHYAVDFDADGTADIWGNKVDAIGSVANYFSEHGWKPGAQIILEAQLNGRAPKSDSFNKNLKPKVRASALPAIGVVHPKELSSKALVAPFRFEAKEGPRYVLGLHNFYVITRYNHSRLYALAVLELSRAIASHRLLQGHEMTAEVDS